MSPEVWGVIVSVQVFREDILNGHADAWLNAGVAWVLVRWEEVLVPSRRTRAESGAKGGNLVHGNKNCGQ